MRIAYPAEPRNGSATRAARAAVGVASAVLTAALIAGCASTTNGTGTGGSAATTVSPTQDFPSGTAGPIETAPPTGTAPTDTAPTDTAPPTDSAAPTDSAPPTDSAAPTGSGGPAPAEVAAFVGEWGGHGRTLTISASGTGTIVYRAYKNCSDDPKPPCDKIENNEIHDGGKLTFQILGTANGMGKWDAHIRIVTSNDPQFGKKTTVIELDQDTDVITMPFFNSSTFCGPKAAAGACGA
jgi:hypothetical protein